MRNTQFEIVKVKFPSLNYIEQFMRLKCAGDILNTGKGPKNIAQITSMFGAYVAYKKYVEDVIKDNTKYKLFATTDYMRVFLEHMIKDRRVVEVTDKNTVIFNMRSEKVDKKEGWIEVRLESSYSDSKESSGECLHYDADHKIISEYNWVVIEKQQDKE